MFTPLPNTFVLRNFTLGNLISVADVTLHPKMHASLESLKQVSEPVIARTNNNGKAKTYQSALSSSSFHTLSLHLSVKVKYQSTADKINLSTRINEN
jgi:hypothetical protein